MGGDPFNPSTDEELESSVAQDPLSPNLLPFLTRDKFNGEVKRDTLNGEDGLGFDGLKELSPHSAAYMELEANRRRRYKAYEEVLQSYDQLASRTHNLEEAKSKILSYTPGGWADQVGRTTLKDYNVPETTVLLLVGPKGSGKSSLVNRISKVVEQDKFKPERAQVSYNSSLGDGTCFLQEYKIPRGSTGFCLYDTRSLSDDSYENIEMLKHWITKGVRHGELVLRQSDDSSLRTKMKNKARNIGNRSRERRMVNFVIFVVNGLEILKSMDKEADERTEYEQMISSTFNCPYLSFEDDKPVVVVTHGDLLSLPNRARVQVYLGELLGIPPSKQIFDIPESLDPATELTITDMLHYSLEHADKNLPLKNWFFTRKVLEFRVPTSAIIVELLIWFVVIIYAFMHYRASKLEVEIDWHSIKHLWLD